MALNKPLFMLSGLRQMTTGQMAVRALSAVYLEKGVVSTPIPPFQTSSSPTDRPGYNQNTTTPADTLLSETFAYDREKSSRME